MLIYFSLSKNINIENVNLLTDFIEYQLGINIKNTDKKDLEQLKTYIFELNVIHFKTFYLLLQFFIEKLQTYHISIHFMHYFFNISPNDSIHNLIENLELLNDFLIEDTSYFVVIAENHNKVIEYTTLIEKYYSI